MLMDDKTTVYKIWKCESSFHFLLPIQLSHIPVEYLTSIHTSETAIITLCLSSHIPLGVVIEAGR